MEALKREVKRKILSEAHDVSARIEMHRIEPLLKNYNTEVISNIPDKTAIRYKKRIVFIITRMVRFHGGQTSVLRLGTELAKQGYNVAYAVYKSQSRKEMQICAASNYEVFEGKLYTAKVLERMIDEQKGADIVIATSWDTVSYAKRLNGYKMYFVQDFEPYFYSFGEKFLLAKKTYEQGLHMVSLGAWNKDMILKLAKPVSDIDVIEFPYEKSEYPPCDRDYMSYSGKKKLTFAVYLKYYGKRLPCILQSMMGEMREELLKHGIEAEVKYFGEAKNFKPKNGINLGMLTKQELFELYKSSDFGITASMSNISLVPYEMISTGLPMIEFEDGTFEYFFPKGSAVMTGISGKVLAGQIIDCLNNPEVLQKMQENAQSYMKDLSWQKTGEEFGRIIEGICAN